MQSGLEFASYLAAGALLGYILDDRFLGEAPSWFFIAGIFLGFAGGIWMTLKKIKRPPPSPPARPSRSEQIKEARQKLDALKKELE
ncbi:MAG: AtpZ/AtpI family protein [Spirochaetales bacterium]|nr:AtpZ/AtpI family protein [Spirochaetales bacterium]